jgi:hypothetical protein
MVESGTSRNLLRFIGMSAIGGKATVGARRCAWLRRLRHLPVRRGGAGSALTVDRNAGIEDVMGIKPLLDCLQRLALQRRVVNLKQEGAARCGCGYGC